MFESNNNERLKGFTLIEAMMATVVLGIAAAALASAFTSGAVVYAEGPRQTLAAQLASDLMEKIVNTPFDKIVDRYDNKLEVKGKIKDGKGDNFTDSSYSNFSRNTECQYVYVDQQAGEKNPIFILATVKVYYSGRKIADITMLIGEYDDKDEDKDEDEDEDESWKIDFL